MNKERPDNMNIMAKMARLNHSDVLGSYTGTPTDPDDQPVQDADDL